MDRRGIVSALREIGARLRLAGDNPFRARAYEAGAEAVESLSDDELKRRTESATLVEIPGIGGALAAVVTDLASVGETQVLDRLRALPSAALLELTQLPGVTRKRAHVLHEALGVSSIDELAAAAEAGRVQEVRGFGPKTEAALLRAIRAQRERPRALRLVEARRAATALAGFVAAQPGIEAAEIAGSVRRWQEVVEEIVVVGMTATQPLPPALQAIASYPPLARVEASADDHVVARLADGVRVRVRLAPHSRWGAILVEETGPPAHLEKLRALAAARGLALEAIAAPEESTLYGALDLPVVPVEAREWAALPPGADLDDLIAEADLQGGVHCHTSYSDGRDSIETMARAADARGLRYLTITDHSPTAAYAGGLSVDRLHAQWDEIARVQEKVKVLLLRGTESDILADGALDYPDAVLSGLDVIIASIHVRHRMDAATMTDRLRRAVSLPAFKIWGHPLGRLILRRDPIACDVDAVLDAVGRRSVRDRDQRRSLPPRFAAGLDSRRAPTRHPLRHLHRRPRRLRPGQREVRRRDGAPGRRPAGRGPERAARGRVPRPGSPLVQFVFSMSCASRARRSMR
ncbi:MAG TPA: helix-hairpin-helix domain-containing protein, partial [Polyangia bacterium]|nr:helix-hairpin-helix domain-containing protein [Polyangia bacterium]